MDGQPAGRERATVLGVVCLASFLNPFMSSALNLAAPAMCTDLGASAVEINWTLTAFLLATAAFLVPCGRLGDLVGRARLFKLGMSGLAVTTLAASLPTGVGALVAVRLLQGVSGSMAFATAMPILIEAYPPRQRGRVLGISTAAVYVGLSMGPPLGGALAQHLGWRAIFLVCGVVGLGVAAAAWMWVPEDGKAGTDARFDVPSAGLYAVGLTALLTGISASRSHPAGPWLLLAGALGTAGFVWRERATATPVLKLDLFGNAAFAFSNLAALVSYSATFAVTFLLSAYLQTVRGLPPRSAGLLLLAQPVLMAVLSPLAGRLSDRVEPRLVASVGMGLTAAGLAVASQLDAASGTGLLLLALVLLGTGFGLFSSPNTNAVMSAVARADYGVASATLSTVRLVGQALSMATVALITAVHLGDAPLAPGSGRELVDAQHAAFTLFAVLCALGVGASLARGRVHAPGHARR